MSHSSWVIMGGSDDSNGDHSYLRKLSQGRPKTADGWGCLKGVRKDDELWFYITAPISAIVAVGKALRDASEGNYWPYDTSVGNIAWIEPPISKAELCRMFPDWVWAKHTRGKASIDEDRAAELRKRFQSQIRIGDSVETLISRQGAGFGDPVKNRKVERAAIDFVARSYRQLGFRVKSVETQNLGYDLKVIKGIRELHLEVKGVSGDIPTFVITENESRLAKSDESYRVVIVLNALVSSRRKIELTGREFIESYDLQPIAYRATVQS